MSDDLDDDEAMLRSKWSVPKGKATKPDDEASARSKQRATVVKSAVRSYEARHGKRVPVSLAQVGKGKQE